MIQLSISENLDEITELAQDRNCWRGLTLQIEKAAEASWTRTGTRNGNTSVSQSDNVKK